MGSCGKKRSIHGLLLQNKREHFIRQLWRVCYHLPILDLIALKILLPEIHFWFCPSYANMGNMYALVLSLDSLFIAIGVVIPLVVIVTAIAVLYKLRRKLQTE